MKNKKGFTLIELLAVIVILAIIALIATPIALNMIKQARRSAAISSSYGYIDAINNYQIYSDFENHEKLKEARYNVASSTSLSNDKGDKIVIDKINSLVRMKGKKPTGGTIDISSDYQVSGATLCINGYVVRYLNNISEVVADDCDGMDLIIDLAVEKEGWQSERKLTINYPEGDYKYYYKVSGNAKVDGTLVAKETDLKATNPQVLILEENQKVVTWMVRNNKKIALNEYKEEKIDNVVLNKPTVQIDNSYPILTIFGVKYESNLKITHNNENSTPYYSVDNGNTWIKYLTETKVTAKKVLAKVVRDESKRESEIVESTISSSSDALPVLAYDLDETTYANLTATDYYINIADNMDGKKVYISQMENYSDYSPQNFKIDFIGASGEVISNITDITVAHEHKITKDAYEIPKGAKKIRFRRASTNGTFYIYEVDIEFENIINATEYDKMFTLNGVAENYSMITVDYAEPIVKKQYKINDSEWKNYENKSIRLEGKDTIYVRGFDINNKESKTVSYKFDDSKYFKKEAYDNDPSTSFSLLDKFVGNDALETSYYIGIDKSLEGKSLSISYHISYGDYSTKNVYFEWVDKDGKTLNLFKTVSVKHSSANETEDFVIPAGARGLRIYRPRDYTGVIYIAKIIDMKIK